MTIKGKKIRAIKTFVIRSESEAYRVVQGAANTRKSFEKYARKGDFLNPTLVEAYSSSQLSMVKELMK